MATSRGTVYLSYGLSVALRRHTEWRYGITSQVPGKDGLHWQLFDVDEVESRAEFTSWFNREFMGCSRIAYPTERGMHGIAFRPLSFRDTVVSLATCPFVDEDYLRIGASRGYWFLHTRIPITPPTFPECTYMRVRY